MSVPRFIVYGKHATQRSFGAMDINAGTRASKLRATMLTREEASKFMNTEAPRNPDWAFEVRFAGAPDVASVPS